LDARTLIEAKASALDEQVEARVQLLERWTSAVRHELGNVLYPSRSLLERASNSPGPASEIAARIGDLMESIDHNRASLACVRPVSNDASSGATIVGEWWGRTRHLLHAVVGRQVRCTGPHECDHALPATDSGLTALALPIFVALDLAAGDGGIESVVVDAPRGELALRIEAAATGLDRLALPSRVYAVAAVLGCEVTSETRTGTWTARARWDGPADPM
jgi:hypothetical protein